MAAKDADLSRDFSLDFVYVAAGTPVAAFEVSIDATPKQADAGATATGDRSEEIFLTEEVGVVLEIELTTLPHSTGGGALLPPIQSSQKSQFASTESMDILLNPFLGIDGSYVAGGADIITLTLKAPDATIYNPAAVWDPVVSMWVAQLDVAEFQEGEWLLYGVSDSVDSLPQFASLWWGDYVDDIQEIRQAALGRWKIEGTTLRLYEEDGLTTFLEFDLKDEAGDPSNSRIFDKDPI